MKLKSMLETAVRGHVGSGDWLGGMVLLIIKSVMPLNPNLRCFALIFKRRNASLKLCKSLFVGCALCGLMSSECIANQMTGTSEQNSAIGQTGGNNTHSTIKAVSDTRSRDNDSSPGRDAFEKLKAFLCHWRVQLATMVISGFSIGYTVGKWRMEKIIKRMTPNIKADASRTHDVQ